jgi:hypothetical protein
MPFAGPSGANFAGNLTKNKSDHNLLESTNDFVCQAEFWCNWHCKTSTVDLEGFWNQACPKNRPKSDPNISGHTAFKYQARYPQDEVMQCNKNFECFR